MDLRPYQQKILDEFRSALGAHSRIVISSPTGSGKTPIALFGLVPILPKPVLWITHRVELADQAKGYGVEVEVQMIQSFKPDGNSYACVIIDEGHHVCADQYGKLFEAYPRSTFVALTATPFRMDGIGLGHVGFTTIIHGPDVYTLTNMGVLCPVRVYVASSERKGAWKMPDAARVIAATKFRSGIVYCRTVHDAEWMTLLLNNKGISAACIHAETNKSVRYDTSQRFRTNDLQVLCNHTIFTEGYDAPGVDLIVLNRLTESRCLWRQMTGRGLRTARGKTHCTILDLAGNGIGHGSIYDKEIYDLRGTVEKVERRKTPEQSSEDMMNDDYEYKAGEKLKEWNPKPRPVRILIETLQKQKSQSSLRRLMTA